MRDPNRIDGICDLLKEVWKQYPDWRLGQLLFNITGQYDMFYVEDDTIENMLRIKCKFYLEEEDENERVEDI